MNYAGLALLASVGIGVLFAVAILIWGLIEILS